jgi:hypothetical protein
MHACLSWNYGLQGANARASVLIIVRHTANAWLNRNRPTILSSPTTWRGGPRRDSVDRHGRCREPAGRDPETVAGSIGGFKEGNARAWVMTVVRNTAYTWLGRNRSAALVITDDLEAVERVNTERGNQSGPEIETPEAALIAQGRRRAGAIRDRGAADRVPRDAGATRASGVRLA